MSNTGHLKTWDEEAHPRHPAGTPVDESTGVGGGRFAPVDGSGPAGESAEGSAESSGDPVAEMAGDSIPFRNVPLEGYGDPVAEMAGDGPAAFDYGALPQEKRDRYQALADQHASDGDRWFSYAMQNAVREPSDSPNAITLDDALNMYQGAKQGWLPALREDQFNSNAFSARVGSTVLRDLLRRGEPIGSLRELTQVFADHGLDVAQEIEALDLPLTLNYIALGTGGYPQSREFVDWLTGDLGVAGSRVFNMYNDAGWAQIQGSLSDGDQLYDAIVGAVGPIPDDYARNFERIRPYESLVPDDQAYQPDYDPVDGGMPSLSDIGQIEIMSLMDHPRIAEQFESGRQVAVMAVPDLRTGNTLSDNELRDYVPSPTEEALGTSPVAIESMIGDALPDGWSAAFMYQSTYDAESPQPVSVMGTFYGPDGNHAGTFNVSFSQDGDRKIGGLHLLEIEDAYQDAGTAENLLEMVAYHATSNGYDSLEMLADITIGKYAWAKYGFDFADSEKKRFSPEAFGKWLKGKGYDAEGLPGLDDIETPYDIATYDPDPNIRISGADIINRHVNNDHMMHLGKAYMLDDLGFGDWKASTSPATLYQMIQFKKATALARQDAGKALKAAWDEEAHPRHPAGTPVDDSTGAGGGRFAPKDSNAFAQYAAGSESGWSPDDESGEGSADSDRADAEALAELVGYEFAGIDAPEPPEPFDYMALPQEKRDWLAEKAELARRMAQSNGSRPYKWFGQFAKMEDVTIDDVFMAYLGVRAGQLPEIEDGFGLTTSVGQSRFAELLDAGGVTDFQGASDKFAEYGLRFGSEVAPWEMGSFLSAFGRSGNFNMDAADFVMFLAEEYELEGDAFPRAFSRSEWANFGNHLGAGSLYDSILTLVGPPSERDEMRYSNLVQRAQGSGLQFPEETAPPERYVPALLGGRFRDRLNDGERVATEVLAGDNRVMSENEVQARKLTAPEERHQIDPDKLTKMVEQALPDGWSAAIAYKAKDDTDSSRGSVSFRGVFLAGDDKTMAGVFSVAFVTKGDGTQHAYLNRLELEEEFQNNDAAVDLMGTVAKHAMDAGFESLSMVADVTIGKYAWAKYGFDFDEASDYHDNKFDQYKFMTWLGNKGKKYIPVDGLAGLDDIKTPYDIATYDPDPNIRIPGSSITNQHVSPDHEMHLGKAYMLDEDGFGDWDAVASPEHVYQLIQFKKAAALARQDAGKALKETWDEEAHPRHPAGTPVDDSTGAGGGRFAPKDGTAGESGEGSAEFDFEGDEFDRERVEQASLMPDVAPAIPGTEIGIDPELNKYAPEVGAYASGEMSAEEFAAWADKQFARFEKNDYIYEVMPEEVMIDLIVDMGITDLETYGKEFWQTDSEYAYVFPELPEENAQDTGLLALFVQRVNPTAAEMAEFALDAIDDLEDLPEWGDGAILASLAQHLIDPLALPAALIDVGHDDFSRLAGELVDRIAETEEDDPRLLDTSEGVTAFSERFALSGSAQDPEGLREAQIESWLQYNHTTRIDADAPAEWPSSIAQNDLDGAREAIWGMYDGFEYNPDTDTFIGAEERALTYLGSTEAAGVLRRVEEVLEESPIAIRVDSTDIEAVIHEGMILNQFAVSDSNGLYDPDLRRTVEMDRYGIDWDAEGEKRPVYGYLWHGDPRVKQYGSWNVVLDDSVWRRATITAGDSLDDYYDGSGTKVGVPINSAGKTPAWLGEWGPEVQELLDYGGYPSGMPYLEVQVHGGSVSLDEVAYIEGPERLDDDLESILVERGFEWVGGGYRRNTRSASKAIKGGPGSGYHGRGRPGLPGVWGGSRPRGTVGVSWSPQVGYDLEDHFGVTAQEVEATAKAMILPGCNGFATVNYLGHGELEIDVTMQRGDVAVARCVFSLNNQTLATHDPSDPTTYHDFSGIHIDSLEIADGEHDSAAAILLPALRMAQAAGYERVTLEASGDVGRYAWAKFGMDFGDPSEVDEYNARFNQWMARMGIDQPARRYMMTPGEFAGFDSGETVAGSQIDNPYVPTEARLNAGAAYMLDRGGMPIYNVQGGLLTAIDVMERVRDTYNFVKRQAQRKAKKERKPWEPQPIT